MMTCLMIWISAKTLEPRNKQVKDSTPELILKEILYQIIGNTWVTLMILSMTMTRLVLYKELLETMDQVEEIPSMLLLYFPSCQEQNTCDTEVVQTNLILDTWLLPLDSLHQEREHSFQLMDDQSFLVGKRSGPSTKKGQIQEKYIKSILPKCENVPYFRQYSHYIFFTP